MSGIAAALASASRGVIDHSVSASPSSVSGFANSASNGASVTATTNATTASVANGAGPFTYAWAYVSGDNATINSPSSASTTFSRTAPATSPATVRTGTFRVTVTDTGNNNLAKTADVTVSTTHEWS